MDVYLRVPVRLADEREVIHRNAASQKARDTVGIEPTHKGFVNLLKDLYPAVFANRNGFADRLPYLFFELGYDRLQDNLSERQQ